MNYFDQIDPINDIFDQIYVHKPDYNRVKATKHVDLFPHQKSDQTNIFLGLWHGMSNAKMKSKHQTPNLK